MQNALARVVSGTRKRDHITPVLRKLHWLPVAQRLEYKVALITHKVLSTRQPQYLNSLISEYRPTRQLRSGGKRQLTQPTGLLSTIGQRTYTRTAETTWNQLPENLRLNDSIFSFKSRLKTCLFQRAFCCTSPRTSDSLEFTLATYGALQVQHTHIHTYIHTNKQTE